MNTAQLTTGTIFTKCAAFATILLLLVLGICQTCGQEVEVQSPTLNQSVVALDSVIAPAQTAGEQLASPEQSTTQFEIFTPESLAPQAIQCESCQSQSVETREICPLAKRNVCVEGRDEVWLVSARQSHLCWSDLSRIEVSLLRDEVWQPSSLDSLTSAHANDKSRATVVYVHGNRTKLDWAKSRGLQVYQSLYRNGAEQDHASRPPVRFVIFAWKSEQEKIRIRRDYELKSQRASIVGKSFGKFLDQFSDREMLLSGFSLGSQVVLAGLTRCETGGPDLPGRYQVALVAPALDASFVCRSLGHLPDVGLIRRTEVIANENDFAIKAAQKIAAKTCREWLPEFKKLARTSDFAINPIRTHDIGECISRQHSTNNYYTSEKVQCLHREMLEEVYAAGQQSDLLLVPAEIVEAPIEIIEAPTLISEEPTTVLDVQPMSVLEEPDHDLQAVPAEGGFPVLSAPIEAVPNSSFSSSSSSNSN